MRESKWGPMVPVYWSGPVCFQRKVWPVGKVRGRESSDRERLSGTHLGWGIGFLEEIGGVVGWRGRGGGGGFSLVKVGESGGAGGEGGLGLFIVRKGFNECIKN